MGVLSAVARRGARQTGRVFDLETPRYITQHAEDTLDGYLRNRRGPRVMGFAGDYAHGGRDDMPLHLGAYGAMASVGIPLLANEAAIFAQDFGSPEVRASRERERELERMLRMQAAHQGGYWDGLELAHNDLRDEVRNLNTNAGQWERYGR